MQKQTILTNTIIDFDLNQLNLNVVDLIIKKYSTKHYEKFHSFTNFCLKIDIKILEIKCTFNTKKELTDILFKVYFSKKTLNYENINIITANHFNYKVHNYYILRDKGNIKCHYPIQI